MYSNYGYNQYPPQNNFAGNPYENRLNSMLGMQQPPRMDIITVSGEEGAKSFQMPPNSKVILLDESNPIIWLCQTDGGGYKKITPYTITPYQAEPPVDVSSLEERIARLEEILNEKPDIGTAKSKRTAKNAEHEPE